MSEFLSCEDGWEFDEMYKIEKVLNPITDTLTKKTLKEDLELLTGPLSLELEKNYIRLPQVAERLGCSLDYLLDRGIKRELDIYAPVLDEGTYVWPVSEQGIPHSRMMGKKSVPALIARLHVGDYQILSIPDLVRIKAGAEVIPEGYLCPVLTLLLIEDLKEKKASDIPASLLAESVVERMQRRSKDVAWIPSSEMVDEIARRTAVGRTLRSDMLCLDSDDFNFECARLNDSGVNDPAQRCDVNPEKSPLLNDPEHSLAKKELNLDKCSSGLTLLERQIRAIEEGIKANNFKPLHIPRTGKKVLQGWCLDNHKELFKSNAKDIGSKFKDAWKKASRGEDPRFKMQDRDIYAGNK